jgi:hypothetical protein
MKKIKYYIPKDNSQAQCIDDHGKNHYLAGSQDNPKETTLKVLVQPFEMTYFWPSTNRIYTEKFIIGKDESTGLRHLVMYF